MMRSRTFSTLPTGSAGRRQAPNAASSASAPRAERGAVQAATGCRAGKQNGRRGADRQRQQGEAVQSHQGAGLHEPEVLGERHAGGVPRKSGEQMAAQPFARRQPGRKGEDAGGVAGPEQPREDEPQSGKKRQQSRQAKNAQRECPGELIGLDQKSGAEPPQAGDEISEAPAPADQGGGLERAGPISVRRAVEEPDRGSERHGERRQKAEGRHGERTDGASGQAATARRHPVRRATRSASFLIGRRSFPTTPISAPAISPWSIGGRR